MSCQAIAIVGAAVVGLLAILVPLLLWLAGRIDRRLGRIEDVLHSLSKRVASLEDSMSPSRPRPKKKMPAPLPRRGE